MSRTRKDRPIAVIAADPATSPDYTYGYDGPQHVYHRTGAKGGADKQWRASEMNRRARREAKAAIRASDSNGDERHLRYRQTTQTTGRSQAIWDTL